MNKFSSRQRMVVGLAVLLVMGIASLVVAFPGFAQTSDSPAAPSSLAVSGYTASSISIYWSDNSTNESEFRIERRFNSGAWSQVGSVSSGFISYYDINLTGAGTYDYRVVACNNTGCSNYSNITSYTINTPVVAAPSGLTASANANSIYLSWTDNSTNETNFSVYRLFYSDYYYGGRFNGLSSINSQTGNTVGNTISYTDTYQLVPNTVYEYVVTAWGNNLGGPSFYSNRATVNFGISTSTPDTTPPSTPTSLSAYVNSSTQISISWAGATNDDGVTGWKIYRDGVEIGWKSSATTPWYASTGLAAGTTYTYTVAAQDAAGNLSPQSASVSATTFSSAGATSSTTSTPSLTLTSCGSITSGGGIKTGIYLIHGYNSEIYGRTDCVADSEQQIQWVTCVEALSGTMFYPQRDNFSYSYTVKNSSGTTIDSGNWTPSYLTSMSSCPSNNGSGSAYTVNYNLIGLQSGTPYTFTVSGINAGGTFSSTAVFRTKSSTFIPTITTSSTTSTSISTPSQPTITTPASTNPISPPPVVVLPPVSTSTSLPTLTPTPTSTPITQCLQAGGLWCYSDYPASLLGYCAPDKSACERGDQAPRAILPQPPAVGLRVSEQFLVDRRDLLQDLRALERLVKRDIIEIDAKQLKIFKEKILSLKPGNEGDLSALQSYRDQITSLQSDTPANTERESTIDPRQEARALQQLKQGLRLFERYIKTIEAKVTQIEKSGITVDAAIKETIIVAKSMALRVKKAKTYSDIRDVVEQMPDVGQALNDALPRLEELLRLPRVLRMVDRRIADGEKVMKQASASAKRLKLDAADTLEAMRGIITNAKSTVAAVKTGGATEGLLDTLQEQVFDTLEEVFDLADHIRAVASVRQAVNQATANVKRYEARLRRLKVGSEDRQTASELLGKFKAQLAGLKELSTQKLTADIGDLIIEHLDVMDDLKTELEDVFGLSSPDVVQEQIKRLLSAPSEKIKPFKIEQLEQGVL